MTTKVCTKCGVEKDVGEFGKHKGKNDGLRSICKECRREYDKTATVVPRVKYDCEHGFKICRKCKNKKSVENFCKNVKTKDGLSAWCRQCDKEYKYNKNPNVKHREHYDCEDGMKRCSKCKEIKSMSEFGKSGRADGGIRSYCKKCSVKYATEYNKNNADHRKEYIKDYSRRYRKTEAGKNVIKAYRIEFEKTYVPPPRKNPELDKIKRKVRYGRDYATPEGKEICLKRSQKYYSTPLGKMSRARGRNKRRALEKKIECNLTLKQWDKILKMQHNCCVNCGKEFGPKLKPTKDHIIPIALGGPFTFGNTQALCGSCNSSKGNKVYFARAITELLVDA